MLAWFLASVGYWCSIGSVVPAGGAVPVFVVTHIGVAAHAAVVDSFVVVALHGGVVDAGDRDGPFAIGGGGCSSYP